MFLCRHSFLWQTGVPLFVRQVPWGTQRYRACCCWAHFGSSNKQPNRYDGHEFRSCDEDRGSSSINVAGAVPQTQPCSFFGRLCPSRLHLPCLTHKPQPDATLLLLRITPEKEEGRNGMRCQLASNKIRSPPLPAKFRMIWSCNHRTKSHVADPPSSGIKA